MVTFKGPPHMLVTLNPPIGNIKRVRFDANGEFSTENERVIKRFHHRFDSLPASKGTEEQAIEGIEEGDQLDSREPLKHYRCNQCDFSSENKGVLLSHKKENHQKES